MNINSPKFIGLIGPSGVGKDAIFFSIAEKAPNFHYAISMTTREPRKRLKQTDGSIISSQRMNSNSCFQMTLCLSVCHCTATTTGLPKQQVDDAFERGQNVLMIVNIDGADEIRVKLMNV